MKPRILHFRLADDDGRPATKGGMTVAVIPDDGYVKVGVSLCHPLDNYDRWRGVTVAVGRAERGSWVRRGEHTPLSFSATPEAVLRGLARVHIDGIPGTCTWVPQACAWIGGPWAHVVDRVVVAMLLEVESMIATDLRGIFIASGVVPVSVDPGASSGSFIASAPLI